MRSNLLKHNNLMLRSERRERLEAWEQATHISPIAGTSASKIADSLPPFGQEHLVAA
jgi:hypothetical protein